MRLPLAAMAAWSVFSGMFGAYMVDGGKMYFSGMPQALEDRTERLAKGRLSDNADFKATVA